MYMFGLFLVELIWQFLAVIFVVIDMNKYKKLNLSNDKRSKEQIY
jgi:hypothetical protein